MLTLNRIYIIKKELESITYQCLPLLQMLRALHFNIDDKCNIII